MTEYPHIAHLLTARDGACELRICLLNPPSGGWDGEILDSDYEPLKTVLAAEQQPSFVAVLADLERQLAEKGD